MKWSSSSPVAEEELHAIHQTLQVFVEPRLHDTQQLTQVCLKEGVSN